MLIKSLAYNRGNRVFKLLSGLRIFETKFLFLNCLGSLFVYKKQLSPLHNSCESSVQNEIALHAGSFSHLFQQDVLLLVSSLLYWLYPNWVSFKISNDEAIWLKTILVYNLQ